MFHGRLAKRVAGRDHVVVTDFVEWQGHRSPDQREVGLTDLELANPDIAEVDYAETALLDLVVDEVLFAEGFGFEEKNCQEGNIGDVMVLDLCHQNLIGLFEVVDTNQPDIDESRSKEAVAAEDERAKLH